MMQGPVLDGTRLLVDGQDFKMLAAEIHNSSSSSPAAIESSFSRVAMLGGNTVLAPVAWSLVEPEEGAFDFTLVDTMLQTARRLGLKLVPLWFGSWKNGMSSYAPGWVKRDASRFPRAVVSGKGRIEHLSPFSLDARAADTAAFRSLMAHLRRVDSARTVVMVQVENEVGLLGDSRDRSALADDAWTGSVPVGFVAALTAGGSSPLAASREAAGRPDSGTWSQVLGDSPEAEEAFMAWAYADYIETVAAAGRAEYDVPLYTNVWLDSPLELDMPDAPDLALAGGMAPGDYPSGGPVPRMLALWRAAAPTLDLIAPDFYFGDFTPTMQAYAKASDGRLFIPEMRRSANGIAQMFIALGTHRALGVSPFGVDSFSEEEPAARALADAYAILRGFTDAWREVPDAPTVGFSLTASIPELTLTVGGTTVVVEAVDTFRQLPPFPSFGALIEERPGVVLAAGRGFTLSFPARGETRIGIDHASEIATDGSQTVVAELNGDESSSGASIRLHALGATAPSVFPIPMTTTSTGLVRILTYTY